MHFLGYSQHGDGCAIMPPMSDNSRVLTGFMERRALGAAVAELAEITDPELIAKRAQEIAQHGSTALAALLAALETDDPQLRGGLGEIAKRLDRDLVVPALQQAARTRERSDHARLTALTILDRFLGETVDESMLGGLQDPDGVALQSLHELTRAMTDDPLAILEYLGQLMEQPPEVAHMILDAVPQLPPDPNLVTLLRMLAQDENGAIAQKAIDRLSRTRSTEALQALTSLALTVPPTAAALAARGHRKLRLSGVPDATDPHPQIRALLSPIDGAGGQVIWFIEHSAVQDIGQSLTLIARDPDGLAFAWGSPTTLTGSLPPARPEGSVYSLAPEDGAPALLMLEAPVAVARFVVQQALKLNWATGTPPPLDYRLLNPLIWAGGDAGEAPQLPAPTDRTPHELAALLDHPAFATWFWQSEAVLAAAKRLRLGSSGAARTTEITALATTHFGPSVRKGYQQRLEGMARWLSLADQTTTAEMAMAAAAHLTSCTPAESPFVRRLIGIGLDVAQVNLQSGR